MSIAVSVENVSKRYRLGAINTGTFCRDMAMLWARLRGQPDPFLKIGQREAVAGDELWALSDVSLEIPQGEVLGVIGRNGAGKSTLLKIMSRITMPTAGRIKLRGRLSSLLEVGTGFHPELTGRENIFMNGTILGMTTAEIKRKFDEIVAFSEVEKFIDTPVKRYSSGMYVRLAFAVAAHLEPEILVVDEVLAVGDAAFQKKCLGKMGEVAGEGRTVLFVSHNMSVINRLCKRAVLLDAGKVAADGPATEVTALYINGADETAGVKAWTEDAAPGGDDFKLLGLKLLKDGAIPVSTVDVNDRVVVRLEYRTFRPRMKFRCCVLFHTQGTLAFAAMEPVEAERGEPGLYFSEVEIPAHLLAESEYNVGVSVFSSQGAKKEHYIKETNAMVFQVYDSMTGDSARGDYAQNIGGMLRPKLAWRTASARSL